MSISPLINCESISKSFSGQTLFSKISLSVFKGNKIGVIGPNGSGKSTLFKVLAGLESPDTGTVAVNRTARIAYVPQDTRFPDKSVETLLLESAASHSALPDYEQHVKVQIIMSKMGFNNPEQIASTMSGGWKKRLAIAIETLKAPDLMLLDEPTNHLDLDGILWLEKYLQEAPFSYMIISHDRFFLEHVTNRMIELNASYPNGLFAIDGTYSNFLERREEFLSGQLQYERSLMSKARREIEWLRQTPKARTTKSSSRIQEAGRLLSELADVKARNKTVSSQIGFATTDRDMKKLLVATNLWKSAGDRVLFSHVNFTLSTGTRLGIVGSNGTGKSTLLRMLTGEVAPDKGTIKIGDGVKIAYFDQHRAELPNDLTLRRALAPDSDRVTYRGQTIHVNAWCKRFLFHQDKLDLPVSRLSGGEKARVLIARLMLQPADILLLDEPTNDLDIPTLEVLEDSLQEFPGAIVLITHDRMLLEEVSTTILGLGVPGEPPLLADYGQWEEYKEAHTRRVKGETEPKPRLEKPAQTKVEATTRKLTFKEKLELENMERNILAAEERVTTSTSAVNNPVVAADPVKLQAACHDLHEAQAALDALYKRWEELENL